MAFLRRSRAVVGLALLAAAGCAVVAGLGLWTPPPGFSHRVHAAEGLECDSCHAGAAERVEAGWPTLRQCLLCHEETDAEKPPERRAAAFFADGKAISARLADVPDEVRFSHARHAEAGLACAECHGDVAAGDRVTGAVRVGKAACMDCHAERGAPNDCATCHATWRPETAPASHRKNWRRAHGATVRERSEASADRCELCHAESACDECHRAEPPSSHGPHFRERAHGILASMDREACATCHETSSCNRCHQETSPRSHRAGWGSPKNTHCIECHFGMEQGCGTCHSGTPSHALAAPLPAGTHTPAMNCRQCHGVTQPLPHVDKGDNCTDCHR
ncbi:MAG: cytochrome c3 family protein [Planctomycetales bacterium]|nr:cytochrome c3 family protein [Planctomycetales bacterium]